MRVAVCVIGRLENRYAVEFVEHYKNIGVDKIFIYDNNNANEEHFEAVLAPFINEGIVDISDWRNRLRGQLNAYQDCYNKHGDEYDWICFFDFDEYLDIDGGLGIKDILSRDIYKDFDMVHVNWLCYDDNGLLRYDERPLAERFPTPKMPLDFSKNGNICENCHIKSIIRGGLGDKVKWSMTPHTPYGDIKCCDSCGNECNGMSPFIIPFNHENMRLRHYSTKTIEEFYTIKVKRGFPDDNKDFFKTHDWTEEFFKTNERTDEKVKLIEELERRYKNKDITILIGTYKDFKPSVTNPSYKIIYGNHTLSGEYDLETYKCVSDERLDDMFYSEIYMLQNLDKKLLDTKYIGFCHYRKYFDFFDDIPNMDELFKDYDVVLGNPIQLFYPIGIQYEVCHNGDDFYGIGAIIKERYGDYYDAFLRVADRRRFYPFNMFIMRTEDFKEYIDFVSGVLHDYINIIGDDITKRIVDNKEKYLKSFPPNNFIEYQYRFGGYIAERLTNVFVERKFSRIKTFGITVTDKKYDNECLKL